VWRQAMVEDAKTVTLEGRNFPVRRTSRSRLRELDFCYDSHDLRGLEQNPETVLDGRDWHAKERRSCSFSADDVTSRLWWMERCRSMEKAGLVELKRHV
jgi:hypothetical protein